MALAILRSSPASGSPSPPSRRAATQPCGGIWDAFCAREAKGPLGALLTEAHFPVLLDLIALSRHGRGGSSGRDCKRWESLQALGANSCYRALPGPFPDLSRSLLAGARRRQLLPGRPCGAGRPRGGAAAAAGGRRLLDRPRRVRRQRIFSRKKQTRLRAMILFNATFFAMCFYC